MLRSFPPITFSCIFLTVAENAKNKQKHVRFLKGEWRAGKTVKIASKTAVVCTDFFSCRILQIPARWRRAGKCVAHVLRLTPNNIINTLLFRKDQTWSDFFSQIIWNILFKHTQSEAHVEDYQYIEDTLLYTHKKTLKNWMEAAAAYLSYFLSKVFLVACVLSPRKADFAADQCELSCTTDNLISWSE